ncbi:hypothetical protein [Peribacillus loiseleuriae]|uniref:Uncharacterized protein n=1 Tax=Peribacillus loiseleuriae TaxID=1679170 RepID=A0A0K9GXJ0_9BACI|nr:hypothetical protein [Peribacillus loiseleuriae]KMY50972.1 hypothetical protein AC625_16745 [Peribacillus loiseleuriae]
MDSKQTKAIVIAGLFGIFLIIAILCVYLSSPKEKEKPVAHVDVLEKVHTGGTTMPASEDLLTEEQVENVEAYISEVVATKKE